jgi:hypothetical protein
MKLGKKSLRFKDALRVKSAELWLQMGEPTQALLELQRVTRRAWKNPWTESVVWRAAQALG